MNNIDKLNEIINKIDSLSELLFCLSCFTKDDHYIKHVINIDCLFSVPMDLLEYISNELKQLSDKDWFYFI